MKRIIFLFFLFVSFFASGQTPFPITSSNVGSPTTGYLLKGLPITDTGFQFRYTYPDTATANNGKIKLIPGAVIRVIDTLFIRSSLANKWIKVGSGGSGGIVSADNGLILSGSTVKLGTLSNPGTLTEGVSINMDTLSFNLNGGGVGVPTQRIQFQLSDGINYGQRMNFYGGFGGSINSFLETAKIGSSSTFPAVAYWVDGNVALFNGLHYTSIDKHYDIFDLRSPLTYAAMQFTGTTAHTFLNDKAVNFGNGSGARVGINTSQAASAFLATFQDNGSAYIRDSLFLPQKLFITDSTGYDILMSQRASPYNTKNMTVGDLRSLISAANGLYNSSGTIKLGTNPLTETTRISAANNPFIIDSLGNGSRFKAIPNSSAVTYRTLAFSNSDGSDSAYFLIKGKTLGGTTRQIRMGVNTTSNSGVSDFTFLAGSGSPNASIRAGTGSSYGDVILQDSSNVFESGNGTNKYYYLKTTQDSLMIGYGTSPSNPVTYQRFTIDKISFYADTLRITSNLGRGIEYKNNYGSTFIARSLVDKGYVDSSITANISGFPPILAMAALGSSIKAEPFSGNFTLATTSNALADGTVRFINVYLTTAQTITGVTWYQNTQGNYTSDNYNGVGLYTYSGGTLTLVASSTDDGTIWKPSSGTWNKKAFSSTYSAAPGLYFIALLYNSSAQTTAPVLACFPNLPSTAFSSNDFTNSAKMSGTLGGQTALPSPTQASSGISASATNFYAALY